MSKTFTFVLWLFFGIIGGHRFYLKRKKTAVLMLVLLPTGVGLLWWLIDGVQILRGRLSREDLSDSQEQIPEEVVEVEIEKDGTIGRDLSFPVKSPQIKKWIWLCIAGYLVLGFFLVSGGERSNEEKQILELKVPQSVQFWVDKGSPPEVYSKPDLSSEKINDLDINVEKGTFFYTKSIDDWVFVTSEANLEISGWTKKSNLIKTKNGFAALRLLITGFIAAVLGFMGIIVIVFEMFFGGGVSEPKKDLRFKTGFRNNEKIVVQPKDLSTAFILSSIMLLIAGSLAIYVYLQLFFV